MWEPFLWLAMLFGAWRALRRRSRGLNVMGPVPEVGDAPADAEPIFRTRLDDNGLATYSTVVPRRIRRARRES